MSWPACLLKAPLELDGEVDMMERVCSCKVPKISLIVYTQCQENQPPQELSVFTISSKEARVDQKERVVRGKRPRVTINFRVAKHVKSGWRMWSSSSWARFWAEETTSNFFCLLLKHCQKTGGSTRSCRSPRLHSPIVVLKVSNREAPCRCCVTSSDVWADQSGWGISYPRVVAA